MHRKGARARILGVGVRASGRQLTTSRGNPLAHLRTHQLTQPSLKILYHPPTPLRPSLAALLFK